MSYNQHDGVGGGGRPYYPNSQYGYDQSYNQPHPDQSYDPSRSNQSYDQPHRGYDQGKYYDSAQYSDQGPYYDQQYTNDPLPTDAPLPHGSEKIQVSNNDLSSPTYPYGPPVTSQYYSDSSNSHPVFEDDTRYGERERTAPDDTRYTASINNTPFRQRTGVYPGSPTQSEAKLLVGTEALKPPPKRLSCWDYTLCRCWPRWARWICCSCLLIIIGLAIAVAVIAATFKMPQISMNGVDSQPGVPEYVRNGTSFSFNFALKIGVVNDNILGATFEKITAEAYYPINNTPMGGGNLTNVVFPAHATTNLTFPFNIDYDPTLDSDQAILNDIASRCGLLGAPKEPIVVNYIVTLYLRIIFVTVRPPSIRKSASIDCPVQDGQLPSFAQNAIPSGIVSGISVPTAT